MTIEDLLLGAERLAGRSVMLLYFAEKWVKRAKEAGRG